jgi:hypothetical protein
MDLVLTVFEGRPVVGLMKQGCGGHHFAWTHLCAAQAASRFDVIKFCCYFVSIYSQILSGRLSYPKVTLKNSSSSKHYCFAITSAIREESEQ